MLKEQTRTKPQKTLELRMNERIQTIFSPPITLVEESKWFLEVTSFEATKSVFEITDKNNSFPISSPGLGNSEVDEELINKLDKLS